MTKFWLALILISLFFSLSVSAPIWQYSLLPKLVQFPWRFLALTAFAVAVLAKKYPWLLLVVVFSPPFLQTTPTFHPESYYTTNDDTTTVQNEYMPKWVKVDPTKRPEDPKMVYFPGVKVVVSGAEIEPEIDDNGLVKTPGQIVFRETPLRLFADAVSFAAITFLLVLFLWRRLSQGLK